jgi:twinkle protein
MIVDDADNPTQQLNKLVADLKKLAVELGIIIVAACHLRKAQNANKQTEEGGRVTLDDLKQSSSVKQLSDIVIGLERNGQSEDPVEANTTKIRVLKDRDFGSKGLAAAVLYEKETTRLIEQSLEDFEEDK